MKVFFEMVSPRKLITFCQANDLPDSAKSHMEKWLSDMKRISSRI